MQSRWRHAQPFDTRRRRRSGAARWRLNASRVGGSTLCEFAPAPPSSTPAGPAAPAWRRSRPVNHRRPAIADWRTRRRRRRGAECRLAGRSPDARRSASDPADHTWDLLSCRCRLRRWWC